MRVEEPRGRGIDRAVLALRTAGRGLETGGTGEVPRREER